VSPRTQAWLWFAQRLSALVLAFAVVVHLATMVYAVRSGLTAGEILDRTRGNLPWLLFYSGFVVAIAVHLPIGLRNVLAEVMGWRGRLLEFATAALSAALLAWGLRAAWAVYSPGAA